MTRRIFLMGVAGMAGCTTARAPRLNVFNWSNYAGPDTIAGFERETGIRVKYSTYESNEELAARIMSGNSGWDVVFPSNYFVQPLSSMGLLAELDHARLRNIRNLEDRFRSPDWDQSLRWSVPYMWGASGILYNSANGRALSAWSDLWSKELRGRVTMLDDPGEVLGACLKRLGYSLNSEDPAELEQAKREAIAQKPALRAYLNAEVRDQMVGGDVLAAQLWATTSQQAMDAAPALRFVYPREGFALYCDTAVILRESRRKELAHLFIDYLLRPDVAAAVVRHTSTATANGAARALLPARIVQNSVLYPSEHVLGRGEWFRALSAPCQRLRDRIWTEVKSA